VNSNWRLAWRNLWRNRRRTWLTVGAMVFSNVLLVFLISLQLGSYDMMIEATLRAFTGHLQVQHRGYHEQPKIRRSIPGVLDRAQALRGELGLEALTARASAFALASSDERSLGIQIVGIEPDYEPLVSSLPGLVREGRWFSGVDAEEIILGKVLARNLKLSLGDEVTFIGSGRDGSFAAGIARVVGILDSGMTELDRSLAQMPIGYFDSVFTMEGHGHSIVVELASLDQVPGYQQRIEQYLSAETDLVVLDWDALQPGLRQAIRADMTSAWFVYSILIVLVAFSVLNTQLMSVLERTREFGIMLALGIKPLRLGSLVAQETALMSLMGLSIGVGIGWMLAYYLSVVGFTYPGMEEMGEKFNLPAYVYPEVSLLSMLWGPSMVFLGAMLAAIYPALRLLHLQPVAAMRAV
jgi:putative ABC transport system permease protein